MSKVSTGFLFLDCQKADPVSFPMMFQVNVKAKTFGCRIEQVQKHQILVQSYYLECLFIHKAVTKLEIRFVNPCKSFDKQIAALAKYVTLTWK